MVLLGDTHKNNHIITKNFDVQENKAPIGLFDSGVGGLSIYQHIYKLLPNEDYIYYADTLNVPYGGRSETEIITLTLKAVKKLYDLKCKLIVIACNSASAYALEIARQKFSDILIVGLVPALKPAVLASKSKHVAVLATKATLDGHLLHNVIESVAIPNQTQVFKYYEPTLVPWVESGMPKTSNTIKTLYDLLDKLNADNVDQLVLGCTHYPFFRCLLQKYIKDKNFNISIVDSGVAIALRVQELLRTHKLQNNDMRNSCFNFYTSRYTEDLKTSLDYLLPQSIHIID